MMNSSIAQILEREYRAGLMQVSLLAYGQKEVFHLQRSPAPDWVVRIYPATNPTPARDRVLALANLLVFLEQQRYPAERVVRTVDGALTTQIEDRRVLVTTYLGSSLQAWSPASAGVTTHTHVGRVNYDPQLLKRVGALLGALHALDTTGPAVELMIAPGLQAAAELAWASRLLERLHDHVPVHLQSEYTSLITRIQQVGRFDECPQTIIHGDSHLGNVVVTPTNANAFIDWEAAGRGAAVTDLGLLLSSSVDPADDTLNESVIHAIIDGYCGRRMISRIERDLLADAIRFRILVTLAGAYEQRSSPDYQPTQRFWGYTYDEWERQEQRAMRIARIAQERLDALSRAKV